MIGNPKWFSRRKYGGWGLYPKTWQGWVYVAAIILPLLVFQLFKMDSGLTTIITIAWVGVFAIDTIHIMIKLKKDEMETKIEALAERNAAWAMVAAIAVGVGYQVARSAVTGTQEIDYFLIATLFAGLIAKAATNIYLEKKGV